MILKGFENLITAAMILSNKDRSIKIILALAVFYGIGEASQVFFSFLPDFIRWHASDLGFVPAAVVVGFIFSKNKYKVARIWAWGSCISALILELLGSTDVIDMALFVLSFMIVMSLLKASERKLFIIKEEGRCLLFRGPTLLWSWCGDGTYSLTLSL